LESKSAPEPKKLRVLAVKVRDLSKSRDYWKEKAKVAERELRQLKEEQPSRSGEANEHEAGPALEGALLSPETEELAWSAPAGHHYRLLTIQLAIQQMIQGRNSLRGCERNFELLAQFFQMETPGFSSVRTWLFRLGLYLLQRPAEYRSDWILILDLTVELGQAKCLVILGIPAARLSETGYALHHQDVEVLEIAILSHSTGAMIEQKLVDLSAQIGTPLQILSDHGSDVKKGIENYQQQHPEVCYTYDVTHQMALLLQHELAHDERYQSFVHYCHLTRQQIQQTELYFLVPPKPRAKARYLNVETYVHWAQQVLAYQAQNDFSQINPAFALDEQTISALANCLDGETLAQLSGLDQKDYPDKMALTHTLVEHLGPASFAQNGAVICQAADVGRRRFMEKLAWLTDYQADIATYAQMVELVQTVEKQVKQAGLHRASKSAFEKNTQARSLSPRIQQFNERIVQYLAREGNNIPEGQTLLATSDIIESIFGKYKLFSDERPLKEIGKMVLTIPVLTTTITSELVKKAMESVRGIDVEHWANRLFGQSMLSKRRAAFNQQIATQKLYEKPP
jgi:hypothetical protein